MIQQVSQSWILQGNEISCAIQYMYEQAMTHSDIATCQAAVQFFAVCWSTAAHKSCELIVTLS